MAWGETPGNSRVGRAEKSPPPRDGGLRIAAPGIDAHRRQQSTRSFSFFSGARRCAHAAGPCPRVQASERTVHVFELDNRHSPRARYRRANQKVALKPKIPTTWHALNRC